jgi:hypothetical protein
MRLVQSNIGGKTSKKMPWILTINLYCSNILCCSLLSTNIKIQIKNGKHIW